MSNWPTNASKRRTGGDFSDSVIFRREAEFKQNLAGPLKRKRAKPKKQRFTVPEVDGVVWTPGSLIRLTAEKFAKAVNKILTPDHIDSTSYTTGKFKYRWWE